MLEKYYKYRIKYNDCLLFFKYGNFYELFDKDAYIISKLFNYKISIISDNIKCGFPVNKLDDILNALDKEHIIAVEMLSSFGWYKYAGHVMSIDTFGVSAPAKDAIKHFNFTKEGLVELVHQIRNK